MSRSSSLSASTASAGPSFDPGEAEAATPAVQAGARVLANGEIERGNASALMRRGLLHHGDVRRLGLVAGPQHVGPLRRRGGTCRYIDIRRAAGATASPFPGRHAASVQSQAAEEPRAASIRIIRSQIGGHRLAHTGDYLYRVFGTHLGAQPFTSSQTHKWPLGRAVIECKIRFASGLRAIICMFFSKNMAIQQLAAMA